MWNSDTIQTHKDLGVTEHTGFPNAGTDSSLTSLDITRLLVQNPSSTFFMRVRGGQGTVNGSVVEDGDIVVIDRALTPRHTDTVIYWDADGFRIGLLSRVPDDYEVWGVVTSSIHMHRRLAPARPAAPRRAPTGAPHTPAPRTPHITASVTPAKRPLRIQNWWDTEFGSAANDSGLRITAQAF